MIFMTMGDEDAADAVFVLKDIRIILDNGIDARHRFFGKSHAAVDDDDVVAEFEKGHILADLAKTSERNDAECAFLLLLVLRLDRCAQIEVRDLVVVLACDRDRHHFRSGSARRIILGSAALRPASLGSAALRLDPQRLVALRLDSLRLSGTLLFTLRLAALRLLFLGLRGMLFA